MERIKVRARAEQTSGTTQLVKTNCNEIIFINLGAANAFIDKMPLVPGGSFTIGGNVGEELVNAIPLTQPVSGQVWVWRKVYQ